MRKALYILGDLDDHDLIWLSASGEVIELAGGDTLIHAGREVAHLYFVTGGTLAVTVPQDKTVAMLGVGDVIGEMSFVEKRPPDVSVVAEGPCRLLRIRRESLLQEFRSNTGFSARFYRALAVFLSDRLRTATLARRSTGDIAIDNELDEGLLDTLHVAGNRMRRLIDVLEGRERS